MAESRRGMQGSRGPSWCRARAGAGRVALTFALLAGLGVFAAVASAGPPGPRAAGLDPARAEASALATGNLEWSLAQLARVQKVRGAVAARSYADRHDIALARGGVTVIVTARDARPGSLALVRRAVAAAGGQVTAVHGDVVRARVPAEGLEHLAGRRGVLAVRPPVAPVAADVVSAGVGEMAVAPWAAAGFDGSGVKIGIIDTGFAGHQALLGTELPDQVITWGKSALGPEGGPSDTEKHGTAVAEVVHDVAPGAQLYLATVDDVVEFGLIEEWMAAQGVTVINHSVGWWGYGPNDGSGAVSQVVSEAVRDGMFWANSAGNSRRMHWMGDFTDADADFWLDWDGVAGHRHNTFLASKDKLIKWGLWWDDSWTAASQDFDLFLNRWDAASSTWKRVASSMNAQSGRAGQEPLETIVYTAPEKGLYSLEVSRAWSNRTDVDFDLWSPTVRIDQPENPDPHYFDYRRSLNQPSDNPAAGFVAVAAVERGPGYAQASYSSEGPTRDGRTSPEVSGPTDVATAAIELFNGTSAASPHVAGVAAILRQAYPSYSPAQVEQLIKTDVVDLGPAGPDAIFGWGRVLLPAVPRDTARPVTLASAAVVRRGGVATLRFRVNDPGFSAGPATVRITVKNSKGKVVKALPALTGQPTCRALTTSFKCTLAKGTYRYFVGAADAAGNAASQVGSAKLSVK